MEPVAHNGGPLTAMAASAGGLAANGYTAVKERLPEPLRRPVEGVEERAAPLVASAQDTGATLLRAADERVDAALSSASAAYQRNAAFLAAQVERQKAFHAANLTTYREAREQYLKRVEDAVEGLKQKGLAGSARAAADAVLARVSEAKGAVLAAPGAVLGKVHDAVDSLLALHPVNSLVAAAKPGLEAAVGQYQRVHDSVVASQRYAAAYRAAGDLAQRAQQTWLYARFAPAVQPALDSVAASPAFNSLVQHLQPVKA